MAGAALEIDISELDRIQQALLRVSKARFGALADVIGTEVESQTRRRIEEEKASPDGQKWEDWSEGYARTRHGNHSLLQNEDHLLDSIHHVVTGMELEVGSNLVYAGVHQEGSEDGTIPPRPYLGLSAEDEADVLAVVEEFLGTKLSGAGLS